MLRRLYDWVLHWAETPYGTWALFLLAFCESSFFPIPPDILLIALAVAAPKKSIRYALVCSVGSVLGGCFGYLIGWRFMETIGNKIILFYDFGDKFNYIKNLYQSYDAWAVGVAGFTPIPYKVFTISAGAFGINFPVFSICLSGIKVRPLLFSRRIDLQVWTQDSSFYRKIFQYSGHCLYRLADSRICCNKISIIERDRFRLTALGKPA